MKEILNSFEYLPRLSEFVKVKAEEHPNDDDRFSNEILFYRNFITQPLTKGIDKIQHASFGRHSYINEKEITRLFEYHKWETIEDAINAGVKLKLKG